MALNLNAQILEGYAQLRSYGSSNDSLDLVAVPGAAEGAKVVVAVNDSLNTLRITDPEMDVTLIGSSPGIDMDLVVVLPEAPLRELRQLSLLKARLRLQGWPQVLVLEENSGIIGQESRSAELERLLVKGTACIKASASINDVEFLEGTLFVAGMMSSACLRGAAINLASCNEKDQQQTCAVKSKTLPGSASLNLQEDIHLILEPEVKQPEHATVPNISVSGTGILEVVGATLSGPRFSDGVTVILRDRGRIIGATGEIATLKIQVGCLLQGDPKQGIAILSLESVHGAELSNVSAFNFSQYSLLELGEAARVSFWTGASLADGFRRARMMKQDRDTDYLASYWATLLHLVASRGAPGRTIMVARKAEMDFRRQTMPLWSWDRLMLEAIRPLSYGQSIAAPLIAQLVVSFLGALSERFAHMLADDSLRAILVTTYRLYLSALGVTSQLPIFRPDKGSGLLATTIWVICVLNGIFCFSAAALAARRRVAYSPS
jgi:hypothetical protein